MASSTHTAIDYKMHVALNMDILLQTNIMQTLSARQLAYSMGLEYEV